MYNRLFTKILDSSIWLESDTTRIVWITLLASMDEDGYCAFSSLPNLARRANVTNDETERAVAILESPDKLNDDDEFKGRRIERVEGGWIVLKAPYYRSLLSNEIRREKTRIRVANWRERQGENGENVTGQGVTQALPNVTGEAVTNVTPAEHSTAEQKHSTKIASTQTVVWSKAKGFEGIVPELHQKWRIAYPACNIDRQLAAMDEWLRCNPTKATKKNWRRFITNWLERKQERGGDSPSFRQPKDFSATNYNNEREAEEKIEASRKRVEEIRRKANG